MGNKGKGERAKSASQSTKIYHVPLVVCGIILVAALATRFWLAAEDSASTTTYSAEASSAATSLARAHMKAAREQHGAESSEYLDRYSASALTTALHVIQKQGSPASAALSAFLKEALHWQRRLYFDFCGGEALERADTERGEERRAELQALDTWSDAIQPHKVRGLLAKVAANRALLVQRDGEAKVAQLEVSWKEMFRIDMAKRNPQSMRQHGVERMLLEGLRQAHRAAKTGSADTRKGLPDWGRLHAVQNFLRNEEGELENKMADELSETSTETTYSENNFVYGSTFFASWLSLVERSSLHAVLRDTPASGGHEMLVLGSSHGWVCFYAALTFGVPCTGLDLVAFRVAQANMAADKFLTLAQRSRVRFIDQDALRADVSRSGIIYITSCEWDAALVNKLHTKLLEEAPQSALIVANDFMKRADSDLRARFEVVDRVVLPVSWNSEQAFYVYRKADVRRNHPPPPPDPHAQEDEEDTHIKRPPVVITGSKILNDALSTALNSSTIRPSLGISSLQASALLPELTSALAAHAEQHLAAFVEERAAPETRHAGNGDAAVPERIKSLLQKSREGAE